MFGLKLPNMSNFNPLEVVGRGSETQLQMGENLNQTGLTQREKGEAITPLLWLVTVLGMKAQPTKYR